MSNHLIMIEKKVPSTEKSFIKMISYFNQIKTYRNSEINFDFTQNTFFAGNICAVLGALISFSEEQSNFVSLNVDSTKESYKYLSNNGFLSSIDPQRFKNNYISCIPYKEFSKDEADEFCSYLEDNVIGHKDFPKLDNSLKDALLDNFSEIFSNASDHSHRETKIFTCGQSFYRNARIVFTIVDLGIGFCECYKGKFKEHKEPHEIIDWCIKKGNTTKNFSGGLGYDLITKFISANNGLLQIYSNNGLWEMKKGEIRKKVLDTNFEGSIINIELNIDKNYSYSY